MRTLNRRHFIQKAAGFAGATMLAPHILQAKPPVPGYAIGFQTWVVRKPLNENFAGTLKNMATKGYETLEMCSPPGYAMAGFAPLQNLSASEMKGIINGEGLTCLSCHYGLKELKDHGPARIEFAGELGLEAMVASSTGLSRKATLDDWKKAADDMNTFGALAAKSNIQFGFHNHHGEFEKLDDQLIYDVLLERLDPDLVKMQFQVAVANIGYKAADYFRAHPGRFISAHLSDWSKEGEGSTAVPIGQGIVDWKDFFEAAKENGVQHIYVEMSEDLLEDSATYLKSLG